jgi:DNA polymerase-1
VCHFAKYDIAILKNHGIKIDVRRPEKIEDTEVLSRLYDAGTKLAGLKLTAEKILGRKMLELEDVCPGNKRLDMISPRLASTYGASDAICTLDLFLFFMSQSIIKSQMDIYKIEKWVIFVVLEMESTYIRIDLEYLKEARKKALKKMEEIVAEVQHLAKRQFNVASTQQLGKVLFEELGYTYPDKKKTEKGFYKTDNQTLEKIADQYPIVSKIVEFRSLEKLVGTYVDNLLTNHEDGYVKVNLKQMGTDTGRFSMPGGEGLKIDGYSGVPFHGLPKVKKKKLPDYMPDIRRSVIARPGYKIVAMDYASEEIRVATNLSREPKWMDELQGDDPDLHAATARAIYNKDKVDDDERAKGKTVNFLVLYGGQAQGLAQKAHISEREAKRLLDAFFKGMPTLKRWIDVETVKARKQKLAKTALGRIRPLHMFYDTGDRGTMSHADRCAVNHLVQGASADIMKLAMVLIAKYIYQNNLQDEIHMLLTVHDEIVFEIKEDLLDKHIPIIDSIMKLESVLQKGLGWPVTLAVDAEYGDSWHITNNYFKEHPDAHLKDPYKFPTTAAAEPVLAPEVKTIPEPIVSESVETVETAPEPTVPDRETSEPAVPDSAQKYAISQDGNSSSEEISQFGADSEFISRNDLTSAKSVIYTIKDRKKSTLRRVNDILYFLEEEERKGVGESLKRIVTIRDNEGNLVSEVRVRSEVFIAFSRYFGV